MNQLDEFNALNDTYVSGILKKLDKKFLLKPLI